MSFALLYFHLFHLRSDFVIVILPAAYVAIIHNTGSRFFYSEYRSAELTLTLLQGWDSCLCPFIVPSC